MTATPSLSTDSAESKITMIASSGVVQAWRVHEVHELVEWQTEVGEHLSIFHLFTEATIGLTHVFVIVSLPEGNLLIAMWAIKLAWQHSMVTHSTSSADLSSTIVAVVRNLGLLSRSIWILTFVAFFVGAHYLSRWYLELHSLILNL